MFRWRRWLSKILKLERDAQPLTTMNKLKKTLEMLEKMEKVRIKQASQEAEKAKEFGRAKNKRAANHCLRRKSMYEQKIELLASYQLWITDQIIMLETAEATAKTMDVLRTGAAVLKTMHKANDIADLSDVVVEINGQHETMEQIQEVVSAPCGAAAFFDKDELEAEGEELGGTGLGEQLLPAATASAAPEHAVGGPIPAPLVPQGMNFC